MTRLSVLLFSIFAVLAASFFAGRHLAAQERQDDVPNFEGQFLAVLKRSNPNGTIELERVQVRVLAGRTFLVGQGADTPDNWQKGRPVWIALDDVSEWTSFSSLEELRKAGQVNEKGDGGP